MSRKMMIKILRISFESVLESKLSWKEKNQDELVRDELLEVVKCLLPIQGGK